METGLWVIYFICLINQHSYLDKVKTKYNAYSFLAWTFGGFFTVAAALIF